MVIILISILMFIPANKMYQPQLQKRMGCFIKAVKKIEIDYWGPQRRVCSDGAGI